MEYLARIKVVLKTGVLDPQGKAIEGTLQTLGFDNVSDVRQGKYIELKISAKNKEEASQQLEKVCHKLLANTVIEDYKIEIEG
tara:strand:- start:103547 stop:103795 length:249 start_codon:yes stop_codon:yes gene_type:complete